MSVIEKQDWIPRINPLEIEPYAAKIMVELVTKIEDNNISMHRVGFDWQFRHKLIS